MTTASSRPSLRSSSGRQAPQDLLSRTPADQPAHHDHVTPPSSITTRRSAVIKSPTTSNDNVAPARKRIKLSPDASESLSKRAHVTSAIRSAPQERPRPPTKLTVAQPHGDLFATTNGVRRQLSIRHDDVPSTASTPQPGGRTRNGTPSASKEEEKRSLRSKDSGGRLKSDLPLFFSNYDDIINDVPKEPEFLSIDTPIFIIDDSKNAKATTESSQIKLEPDRSHESTDTIANPLMNPPVASSSQTEFPIIDFTDVPEADLKPYLDSEEDPLADSKFFAPHRRAERKEKQLRNIEKEKAMHEKARLDRLLEGLQGPDWLRVMGVVAIPDGHRKQWEVKRKYFVDELRALVDKFRLWKDEDRRQRLEREAALHPDEDEEDEGSSDDDGSGSDGLNSSDIDASAAHQLLQEAKSASRMRKPKVPPGYAYLPPAEEDPNKPFTSFFSKPHLRAQALSTSRQGRVILAFGHPVPEPGETTFNLPHEYLTPDALKDHARKKRRMKRESVSAV